MNTTRQPKKAPKITFARTREQAQLDRDIARQATDPTYVPKTPGRKRREDRSTIRSGNEGHPYQVWFTKEEWRRVNNDAHAAGFASLAEYIRTRLFGGES
jgi:hypothetical protein